MALSSDLLKKFNQEDISLCDRLNAGKNLFCTLETNYISRKEDFVLDWLCKLLGKHDTLEVWKTIRDCLSSGQMQKIKALDIKVTTKEALCKILAKSSQSHNLVHQECALLCLECAVFQQHFRTYKQSFISIIQMLLKSIGNSGEVNAFIRCSKDLRSISKQNFGDEKLFTVFVKNFLLPSVEAYTMLVVKVGEGSGSSKSRNQGIADANEESIINGEIKIDSVREKEVGSELESEFAQLIQEILFPGSFDSMFYQFFSTRMYEAHSDTKVKNQKVDLLCLCLSSVVSAFPDKVVINLYTIILQAFVQSYSSSSLYPFFVLLCSFLGFSPRVQETSNSLKITLSPADKALLLNPKTNVSFSVLRSLLNYLVKVDLMFDSAIRGISFLQWLQALVLEVVLCKVSSFTYQIIHSLSQLNPLIVAPLMSELLAKLLFQAKPSEEERNSYKCFIQGIFDTFIKLNQIPELLGSNILPTLKQALQNQDFSNGHRVTISDVLPEGSLSGFTYHLVSLPNTVCVSLLKTFVQYLEEDILKAVEKKECGSGCWLVLEVLAHLLEAFFSGVRLAEQRVPMHTRTAFVSELLKLRTALGSVGCSLLKREHNNEALAAFLRMSHSCGEIQLLLLWYSPLSEQGAQLQPHDESTGKSVYDLHCLHSFLNSEQWKSVGDRVESSGDEVCCKMLDNLLLQKLNLLSVFSSNFKHSIQMKAALCKHFLENLDNWWSVFLGKQSSALTSLLTPEQFIEVSETVVSKLISLKKEKFEELENPLVQENQPFVIALAWVTIQRISQLFQKKRRRDADVVDHDRLVGEVVKLVDPVTALLVDGQTDDVMKAALPQMAALINAACSTEEKSKVASAFVLDLRSLEVHLCFLKNLPLLFLPKLIRTALAIPTLAVIVCLNKRASEENTVQIRPVQRMSLDILLSLMELTYLSVMATQLDPGELVKQLHSCGCCPPEVLQPMFMSCLRRHEKLQKLATGTCQIDYQLGANSVPLSLQLLQYIGKFPKLMKQEAYKTCVKQLSKSLGAWMLRHLDAENQTSPLCTNTMLDAYSCLLLRSATKPKLRAKYLPYLDTVVSAALLILKESSEQDAGAVHHAMAFLKVVIKCRPHWGEEHAKNLVVTVFHTASTVRHKDKLLPDIALLVSIASEEEFCEIMQRLNASEDLKYSLVLLNHLVKLRLPTTLSRLRKLAVKHVFEDLNKAFVEGHLKPLVAEALALELAVAVNMIRTLPRICDVLLLTVKEALEVRNEPVGKFGPVCLLATELLSRLAHSSFPVIEERIPNFLQTIRLAVHAVVAYSGTERQLTGSNLETMTNCAHHIERFCLCLMARKETFKSVAHFAVADILLELTETSVHHIVKKPLLKSLYSLFEFCDAHSNQHLLHALPYASMELYKKYSREYRKFYRYKGKV